MWRIVLRLEVQRSARWLSGVVGLLEVLGLYSEPQKVGTWV